MVGAGSRSFHRKVGHAIKRLTVRVLLAGSAAWRDPKDASSRVNPPNSLSKHAAASPGDGSNPGYLRDQLLQRCEGNRRIGSMSWPIVGRKCC